MYMVVGMICRVEGFQQLQLQMSLAAQRVLAYSTGYACAYHPGPFAHIEHHHHRASRLSFITKSDDTTTDSATAAAAYQKTYRLQGATTPRNKSGVTVTTNTGHTLSTDVPKKMGGKDTAPQPVETLLAALIGCTQATALFVGRHLQPERLVLDRLEFDLTASRDERGAIQLPLLGRTDDDDDDENENESTTSRARIPSRLQQVKGTVTVYAVKNQRIAPEALKLLKEETEERCPVANMMIASGCRMDVDWVDGNAGVADNN